jgi:putative membrane protein
MRRIVAAMIFLAACSPDVTQHAHLRPREPLTPGAQPLASQDRDFIERAAQGGNAEIKIGGLAPERALRPEVIAYGRMMVDAHSSSNRELTAIADTKRIVLPSSLGDNQASFDRVADFKLDPFDREFVKVMVEDHQMAAQLFQNEANGGSDPALKSFAAATLPMILDHLAKAKALAASIPPVPQPLTNPPEPDAVKPPPASTATNPVQ